MATVPAKVSYLVTKQGNRNLALDGDYVSHESLNSAKESAGRATRTTGQPHYVHELSVKLLFSYKPGPAMFVDHQK